jgi:hypothetical protein
MLTDSQKYLDIQSRIVQIIRSCTHESQLIACEKLVENFSTNLSPLNIYDRFLVTECAIHLQSWLNSQRDCLKNESQFN